MRQTDLDGEHAAQQRSTLSELKGRLATTLTAACAQANSQRSPRWRPSTGLALLLASYLAGGCGHAPEAGQRWVDNVHLQGVKALDQDELLEGLATRETGWWPFAKKHWFEPGQLDQDIRRIQTFYAARGYFQARVTDRQLTPQEDGAALDVHLTIDEGPATTVADITYEGLEELPEELRRRLLGQLPLQSGRRFSYERYLQTKQALKERLIAKGFYYAEVGGQVQVDRQQRTARIRVQTTPGPRVRLGKTQLAGAGELPAHKLRRLISWQEGAIYDPREFRRTRRQLTGQRVFSTVEIALPEEPQAIAPVTIRVQPSKLGELQVGGGLGVERQRQELRLRLDVVKRNFFGGLRTLTYRLRPAYVAIPAVWDLERHGFAGLTDLKLVQPDAWDTRITLAGMIGYELGLHEGYRFHGPLAQLGGERTFFDDVLRLGLSWNLKFIDFFDKNPTVFDSSAAPGGLGFQDPYNLAYLEELAELDLRDEILDPRQGFFASLRLEQGFFAIGSEFTYLKLTPEIRGYIPLGTRRLTLALRALWGYLRPAAGENSPVSQRYYLGGPSSHRGFSYGRLSPQAAAENVPLGGNSALLFSGDLRLRAFRLFGNWLGVSAFCDAGDVEHKLDALDLSALHLAVGGGLSYATPIGSLSLSLGVRLNRLRETQPDGRENPDPGQRLAFHLTLGNAF